MNLATIIEGHPAERPALVSRGKTITYGELRDRVGHLRAQLAQRGVEPGDRVAIIAANNWFFVAAYLAAVGLGAIAVPLNPESPAPEIERELAAVSARLALVGPGARTAASGLDTSCVPGFEGLLIIGDLVEAPLAGAGGEPPPLADVRPEDPAVLLFTSGTAGAPRPAILTHGNLRANIDQMMAGPAHPEGPDDVALAVLPLSHVFGLNAVLDLMLSIGGSVVLAERFDPHTTLQEVATRGVTLLTGVPAMWAAWAALPRVPDHALDTVRLAVSGAAPLDPDVRQAVHARLGLDLAEGYGLTEASPAVTSGAGHDAPDGSIGVPLPGVEVRLVDSDGEDALVGDPGEIWVRGPNVFPGYWNDPGATAAALTPDGWLRTGDVAVVDEGGYLSVVDRAKDVIVVSGFNVFPAEVEDVLEAHPGVAAAAVVGVPHPQSGETVKAFVIAEPGARLEEDAVIEHAGRYLARYKCPSTVAFVDEIPHGITGKVLRRALRT